MQEHTLATRKPTTSREDTSAKSPPTAFPHWISYNKKLTCAQLPVCHHQEVHQINQHYKNTDVHVCARVCACLYFMQPTFSYLSAFFVRPVTTHPSTTTTKMMLVTGKLRATSPTPHSKATTTESSDVPNKGSHQACLCKMPTRWETKAEKNPNHLSFFQTQFHFAVPSGSLVGTHFPM